MTVQQSATRMVVRAAGLSLAIALFAGVAALFSSETATRWMGLVGFAVVIVATATWAWRDAKAVDLNSCLRDWLVVSFLVAVGWWIVLTLYEGEHDVVERLGTDFWSVMSTVGLVFAAALVGCLTGRSARAAGTN